MSRENDYDFHDQHKILVLEKCFIVGVVIPHQDLVRQCIAFENMGR